MKIDKKSRIPVYVQVMDLIIAKIEDGILREEMKLPSERELCNLYDVSRTTIRQAMSELERDGYINTYKGRGSFVAEKRFNQDMSALRGLTESMKQLGKTISTTVIDSARIKCDQRMAQKMQCAVGAEIYRFTRVRYADNEPVMVVTTHMPCARFPNFDAMRLSTESLYEIMVGVYGVTFTEARETLRSVRVRGDAIDLLKVEQSAPCMRINRFTYEKDMLIEYGVGIARGDKFEYNIKLR